MSHWRCSSFDARRGAFLGPPQRAPRVHWVDYDLHHPHFSPSILSRGQTAAGDGHAPGGLADEAASVGDAPYFAGRPRPGRAAHQPSSGDGGSQNHRLPAAEQRRLQVPGLLGAKGERQDGHRPRSPHLPEGRGREADDSVHQAQGRSGQRLHPTGQESLVLRPGHRQMGPQNRA